MSWLKDWKLKLRYGRLKTAFRHFTLIADGEIIRANPDFDTVEGMPAFFRMKVWATDSDEATHMVAAIGRSIGFDATGRIYVYNDTEAEQPPGDKPHGYDLGFTHYVRE